MSDPSFGGGPGGPEGPGESGLPGYPPQGYGVYPGGGPGLPVKRPMPDNVKLAANLMLLGAGVKALEGIVLLAGASGSFGSGALVGGFIGAGLWIWMAAGIRKGANWARVTGTVFFGIACCSLLLDLLILLERHSDLTGIGKAAVVFDFLNWGVGLWVTILIWQQRSTAFFHPQLYGAPTYPSYGQPGYPPQQGGWPTPPPGPQPPEPPSDWTSR
jgi:hypothetical protein